MRRPIPLFYPLYANQAQTFIVFRLFQSRSVYDQLMRYEGISLVRNGNSMQILLEPLYDSKMYVLLLIEECILIYIYILYLKYSRRSCMKFIWNFSWHYLLL